MDIDKLLVPTAKNDDDDEDFSRPMADTDIHQATEDVDVDHGDDDDEDASPRRRPASFAHVDAQLRAQLMQQEQEEQQQLQQQKVVHENQVLGIWERQVYAGGFTIRTCTERNSLTDCYLGRRTGSDAGHVGSNDHHDETPLQIKIIGRHMNGSFRCHIGTGKQSRPIHSDELRTQMKLMVVFFRSETCKNPWVLTEFLCFPTWLLHLFRYAHHDTTPGRTDVRFLENASLAKEDHIYRLNHVLNSLFRFQLHALDHRRMSQTMDLANYLFDTAGLYPMALPKPRLNDPAQPPIYTSLILLLQAPRPSKQKTMCHNCHAKPSSRRQLCVACYRYQLKHHEPRPLRLIVASRPGPRASPVSPPPQQLHQPSPLSSPSSSSSFSPSSIAMSASSPSMPSLSSSAMMLKSTETTPRSPSSPAVASSDAKKLHKRCDNCGVTETHQWYRNLCGQGHWCETCKSYYLRHGKMRPPELFVKAAKRKVDVRAWMDSTCWRLDSTELAMATMGLYDNHSGALTSPLSAEETPHHRHSHHLQHQQHQHQAHHWQQPLAPPSHHHHHHQQQQQQQRRWSSVPAMLSSSSSPPTPRPHPQPLAQLAQQRHQHDANAPTLHHHRPPSTPLSPPMSSSPCSPNSSAFSPCHPRDLYFHDAHYAKPNRHSLPLLRNTTTL